MSDIHAVLFDFGQVLSLPPDPAVWQQMKAISGLSEGELHAGYWSHRDDYDAGLMTGNEYWSRIVGSRVTPAMLDELKAADVALWTRLNEPMMSWVKTLHGSGIRTGILSNMPDAMAEGICAQFDWIGNFDHAVWSYALKMKKPQPEIYHAAATGLGVQPQHILFIDDKPENTAAAEAMGMHAIIYSDHETFVEEMKQRGMDDLLELDRPSQI